QRNNKHPSSQMIEVDYMINSIIQNNGFLAQNFPAFPIRFQDIFAPAEETASIPAAVKMGYPVGFDMPRFIRIFLRPYIVDGVHGAKRRLRRGGFMGAQAENTVLQTTAAV